MVCVIATTLGSSISSQSQNPETQKSSFTIQYTPVFVRHKEVVPPTSPIPKGYYRHWTHEKGFELKPITNENWWKE